MSAYWPHTGSPHRSLRKWIITCLVVGGLLLLAGVLLSAVPLDHGTIPQWNGLCSSGLGQLGQLFSAGARSDCGVVGLADHAIGWLIGAGVAAVVAGVILAFVQAQPVYPPAPPATAGYPLQPGGAAAMTQPSRRGGVSNRAVIIAVVAALLVVAICWGVTRDVSGSSQLESYLCWNGPGDSGATLLQWLSGGTVDGTYREASISGTAPDQQVSTGSGALTGTISGPSVSLDLGGSGELYGKLGTDLVLNVPLQDGTLQPMTCKPGSTSTWNRALTSLDAQTNTANTQAAAAEQAQQVQQQTSEAQSSLASDAATLSQDASTLDTNTTLAADIQQMRNDLGTEQSDYGTVEDDSCSSDDGVTIESDAVTVDSDADTVDSDLDTLQSDIQSLQDNSVASDLSTVEGDVSTIRNLGGTPEPNPVSAIHTGKKALRDFANAVRWANSNGNQIDAEAHQIDNEASNLANC